MKVSETLFKTVTITQKEIEPPKEPVEKPLEISLVSGSLISVEVDRTVLKTLSEQAGC